MNQYTAIRATMVALVFASTAARADLAGYYGLDAGAFQRMTGASVATEPYPVAGTLPDSFSSGSVTLSPAAGSSLFLANWSALVPIRGWFRAAPIDFRSRPDCRSS